MFSATSRPLSLPVLLLLCLTLAEVRCASRCGVQDAVSILDERPGLYLVYRVSGAHDKMEFFEIYQAKPDFDACGSTTTPAAAKEPYLRSQGLLKKVEWRDKRLRIIYTSNPAESVRPDQARLFP